ncbi:DUF4397 domain-containing protein [Alteromonas sp. C1M14]|uniref:DUF4397 domain-containing protein n=1 Tax=Alteromonas sp. C1M14 TaxID=2841567 RepID=UPI001C096FED|nr:DUF4397 domain-containing protein [Alteromonas sp. C1M14]
MSLALLSMLCLSGCLYIGDDDSSDGHGYYQYVNLVPQSPDIEFVVDDESQGDLSFAEATAYDYVSNSTYDIEFNQILPNTENDNFIDDDSLKVKKKTLHSYILYGDTDSPSSYEIDIDVSDVFDDDFDDNYAMVRFANLANYNDSVDVYILDADGSLTNQTADYTLAPEDDSGDVELDAGDYKIVFTESGTDTILAMKNDITIEEGEALSYVFVSYENAGIDDTFYSIVELNDDGARQLSNEAQDSYLRVSNNVANTTSISVAKDTLGNTVAEDLYFGDISDFLTIDIDDPDDANSVDIYLRDTDSNAVLESTSIDFYADQIVLLLSSGDATSTVTSYADAEDLRVIDTHAKLLFSHNIDNESSTSIAVKVIEQGSNPDSYDASDEIGYLSSLDIETEAGDYDIYVYDADTNDLLLETTLYDVLAGDVINVVLSDYDYGGAPYQMFTYIN